MIVAKTMGANVMSRGYRMSKHLFPVVVLTALSTAAPAQIPTMNQMWRTNRDMAIQQQQQMLDDMRLQQQEQERERLREEQAERRHQEYMNELRRRR